MIDELGTIMGRVLVIDGGIYIVVVWVGQGGDFVFLV